MKEWQNTNRGKKYNTSLSIATQKNSNIPDILTNLRLLINLQLYCSQVWVINIPNFGQLNSFFVLMLLNDQSILQEKGGGGNFLFFYIKQEQDGNRNKSPN